MFVNYSGRTLRRVLVLSIILPALFIAADLLLPVSGSNRYQHDKRGRLSSRTTPDGQVVKYCYNNAGQLTRISYHRSGRISGWAYPAGSVVNLDYDPAGNLISLENEKERVRYSYDDFGRPVEVISSDEKRITYKYDPWSNIQSITLPDGYSLRYGHDLLGNITDLDDGYGNVRYDYNGNLNQVIRRLPNGVSTIYQSSPAGQLITIRHQNAEGDLICSYRYEYDSQNRISLMEETTPRGRTTSFYEYDLAGRLIKVSQGSSIITYEYDSMGDRTAQTTNQNGVKSTIRYLYDSNRRLIKAGEVIFSYDASGNLVSRYDGSQLTTYRYDAENRLLEIRNGNTIICHAYDGNGNRVSRGVNGRVKHYLIDRLAGLPQVVSEYEEDGKTLRYLLGQTRVAQRDSNGEVVYLLEDQLGSTRCVVDGQGKVKARYDYSPFGAPVLTEGTPQTDFLFCGEQWDRDAQLLYLRARYFDPKLGRFLSVDPVTGSPLAPETFNQYAYVNNDPVNKVDPSGMQGWPPPPYYNPWRDWWKYVPPPLPPRDYSHKESAAEPQKPVDPNEYRPIWVESLQKGMEDWAVDILSRNPQSAGGKLAGIFSAADYAILEHFYAPIETEIRKLSDPDYTNGHPWRSLGTGISLANDLSFFIPTHVSDPRGLSISFREGIPLTERIGTYAVNETWASKRIYLPFIDQDYPSSKTLKIPFEKVPDLHEIGENSYELIKRLGNNHTVSSSGDENAPSVGGVYLDQTAKVIGKLGTITGAMYDEKSGHIILIGDKNTALPTMKPEYLAAAICAVYSESKYEPGMTIDPFPQNPRGPIMMVIFFGNTENTLLGWVMFEADRLMKGYSVGTDNITKEPIHSSVPGYQSVTAMGLVCSKTDPGLWSRFWLVPEPVTGRVSQDGRAIVFDPIRIRVKTETMRLLNGKLVPAGNIQDPCAEIFSEHFTKHYEEFAKESPIFGELKLVTQAVALAKWMRQQGVKVDWNFVNMFAEKPNPTPRITPSAYAEREQTWTEGALIRKLKVATFGGVEMTPQLLLQNHTDASKLQDSLTRAWATASNQGESTLRFQFDNKEYEAALLPVAGQSELLSYNAKEIDLAAYLEDAPELARYPGLARYYNSTHNEQTEFNYSWSMLLPRLEFEAAGEKGQARYISVEGDPATRTLVQQFVLADQFGIVNERFVKSFVDQNLKRIGFAPERTESNYRGLYPESDGTYRLFFTNGDQAIFDSGGRLRAVLTSKGRASYEYDDQGRLTIIQLLRAGRNEQVRFGYDTKGRLAACEFGSAHIVFEYDLAGNLCAVKSANRTVNYHYNNNRLLTEVVVNGRSVVQNDYDDSGRLLRQRDLRGDQLEQSVESTADGKVLTVKNGSDFARRYYDRQLRLTKADYSNGSSYQYRYDSSGRLAGVNATLPTGGEAKLEVSPDRRAVMIQDPRGVRKEYHFDPSGRPVEVFVNNRSVATYHYDTSNRLVEVAYEGGSAEQYAYDGDGRLLNYRRVTTASQAKPSDLLNYTYDPKGELIGIGNSALGEVSLAKQSQSIAVMRGTASLTYRYGDDGRLSKINLPDGSICTYGYEQDGQLSLIEIRKGSRSGRLEFAKGKLIYNRSLSGGQTRYTYTPAGLLSSVEDHQGTLTTYFYDNQNRLQRIKLPDGRCLEYLYDPVTGQLCVEHSTVCQE